MRFYNQAGARANDELPPELALQIVEAMSVRGLKPATVVVNCGTLEVRRRGGGFAGHRIYGVIFRYVHFRGGEQT